MFKNDIRRNFINMYVNVHNAMEETFVNSFFQSIFHPDAKYHSIEYGKYELLYIDLSVA